MIFEQHLEDILDAGLVQIKDMRPSDWAEANRVLTSDVSSREGPFSFRYTPYLREVIDTLSPNHPARIIAVKKGAQIGFSTGVIENGIGWIIAQNPGNILFMSGHIDLAEEAMNQKIDQMIDSCGLRKLIRPSVVRKRNSRTGDTSRAKEFPGGSLKAGSASNHALLRQRSVRFGFIDDFDSAKKSTKQSGNTRKLIEQRFAAYYDKMKLFYISTPELLAGSNIEPVFQLGDQRYYHVPCPKCGEMIALKWEIAVDEKEKAGITWRTDSAGKLIDGSVGYICQKCGDFFDDSLKFEMNNAGQWMPTAEPSEIGYYSYHISSLYAPPGMYDWEYYVRQYMEANPAGRSRKDDLHKTFVNLCLGEPYEDEGKKIEANSVQKKVRNYPIGIIPDNISRKDGNGQIIMLTCCCDLNGKKNDARLDWEIIAWSESGSSYAIKHGSIGTFIPNESKSVNKVDREHWTYEMNQPMCVWPELERLLGTVFETDNGRKMRILFTGVDTGHYTDQAYAFIDSTNHNVVGLKGNKEEEYRRPGIDMPLFKPAKERVKLFLLDVNHIKDKVSNNIELNWNAGSNQPPEFMNYPTPSDGLYLFENYFQHYEAEHRVEGKKDDKNLGSRWMKKNSGVQNHFWDVFIYNYALKEIWAWLTLQSAKPRLTGGWPEFVEYLRANKKL